MRGRHGDRSGAPPWASVVGDPPEQAPVPPPHRRIVRAIAVVGASMGVFALASFLQDVVVARRFGAGETVDAFVLALVVPTFVAAVVSDAFTASFLPAYVEATQLHGEEAGRRLFSSVMAVAGPLLVGLTIVLAVLTPALLPLLAGGLDRGGQALAGSLMFMLVPMVPLSGAAAVWRSTLNARERFGLAAISRSAVPATAIVAVLVAHGAGIRALAAGIVAGFVVQLSLLVRGIRSAGLPVLPRYRGADPAVRRVFAQSKPMAWGAAILGGAPLVDGAMASRLGEGSVAALHYGNRVPMMVTGIAAAALGTAVFPYLARLVATGQWGAARSTVRTYGIGVAAVTAPLAVGIALGSEPLVRLLFERGAFGPEDTDVVASVQALLSLQVPFFLVGVLLARLVAACQANEILMRGAVLSLVLNVALNLALMEWIGVRGIALSTSLVYLFSSVYIGVMLNRLLKVRSRAR